MNLLDSGPLGDHSLVGELAPGVFVDISGVWAEYCPG
jgi:hypothetical protein